MLSGKSEARIPQAESRSGVVQAFLPRPAGQCVREVTPRKQHWRVEQRRLRGNGVDRGRVCFAHDNGHAALDDARLFTGNRLHGIAKVGRVLQVDVRDGARSRFDDVCGIQPPAHAHFNERHVHLGQCKVAEGDCRVHFEEGGGMPQVFGGAPEEVNLLYQRALVNGRAIDQKPLLQADEVRAREAAGAVSRGAQHGVQRGHHAALAVGSGHMHSGIAAFRIARALEQKADVVQAEFHPVQGQAEEVVL